MAGLTELWPEDRSRFMDLGDAFTEKGESGGVVILRQEANESRAAFDQRLAILKAQHPARTIFVCVVREAERGREAGAHSG